MLFPPEHGPSGEGSLASSVGIGGRQWRDADAAGGSNVYGGPQLSRWMQKNILEWLAESVSEDPLKRVKLPRLDALPTAITRKWKPADFPSLLDEGGIGRLPIDHSVLPSPIVSGGSHDAARLLDQFIDSRLSRYGSDRNHPDEEATTGLSPHLHFGHISAQEVVHRVLDHEDWTPDQAAKPNGKNHGFWNTSEEAEGFLDQMLTWREMGFNMAHREPDRYDKFESLASLGSQVIHGDSRRRATHPLHGGTIRAVRDPRRTLECGPAAIGRDRCDAQLHADAVGQKDPALDGDAAGCPGDHDSLEQQVRSRRPRSEFLQRHFLGARALRPSLGTEAAGLWQHSLHDQRQCSQEAATERLSRAIFAMSPLSRNPHPRGGIPRWNLQKSPCEGSVRSIPFRILRCGPEFAVPQL